MSDPPGGYEQWWRALLKLFRGVGFVFDGEGRYVDVVGSEDAELLLSDDPEELVGLHLSEVVSEARADRFLEAIRRVVDADESLTIEYRLDVQAGTRWFEGYLTPLYVDGETRVLWLSRDITDRKRRERELRRSQRRFRAIFDDPHLLIGILDPDGSLRRVNSTALEVVDADASDLEGRPFWRTPWWSHDESLQADLREWIERAASGEYVTYRSTHYSAAGERLIVSGQVRPVTNDAGEVVSIIVSGREVTDHELHKQRLQVLHRILRHNLRNQLNAIQGYAGRFVDGVEAGADLDDETRDAAATIADHASNLERLVEKVDRFRKVERGESIEYVPIENVFSRLADRARTERPACTVETSAPEERIEVPRSIEIALVEAVENALEHHDRAEPAIELTGAVVTRDESSMVRLRVVDDGPGIPESELEPLLAGEETTLEHASSVGLWIIKWIVESLGGTVTLGDADPRGSAVTLTIPHPSDRP